MSHLVLLAENQAGYHNLCKLATTASLDGFYHKPRIDKHLLASHCQGLIGLSACLKGEIPQLLRSGKRDAADASARFYLELLGEHNFFLEVQHNGIPDQEIVNREILEMSWRLSIPMVATNDCHYLDKAHARAHDVLLCVQMVILGVILGTVMHKCISLIFRTVNCTGSPFARPGLRHGCPLIESIPT
ncbi:MAG: PHP domain-containing protein [Desulfosalsimonadaceae bacterium]